MQCPRLTSFSVSYLFPADILFLKHCNHTHHAWRIKKESKLLLSLHQQLPEQLLGLLKDKKERIMVRRKPREILKTQWL